MRYPKIASQGDGYVQVSDCTTRLFLAVTGYLPHLWNLIF